LSTLRDHDKSSYRYFLLVFNNGPLPSQDQPFCLSGSLQGAAVVVVFMHVLHVGIGGIVISSDGKMRRPQVDWGRKGNTGRDRVINNCTAG